MDTYELEERILSLLMFTSDFRKEGEAVLESYVKQSGKERIIGAYLTQVGIRYFCEGISYDAFHPGTAGIRVGTRLAGEPRMQAGASEGTFQRERKK